MQELASRGTRLTKDAKLTNDDGRGWLVEGRACRPVDIEEPITRTRSGVEGCVSDGDAFGAADRDEDGVSIGNDECRGFKGGCCGGKVAVSKEAVGVKESALGCRSVVVVDRWMGPEDSDGRALALALGWDGARCKSARAGALICTRYRVCGAGALDVGLPCH